MGKNQKIKCNVVSCKHQESDKNECKLDEIKVDSICDNDDCNCCTDTICDSFDPEVEKETNEKE